MLMLYSVNVVCGIELVMYRGVYSVLISSDSCFLSCVMATVELSIISCPHVLGLLR